MLIITKTHIVLLFIVCYEVYAYYDSASCYNRPCPAGTAACKKVMRSTDEKNVIATTVACLDEQDMVLKEYYSSEYNSGMFSTHFESTSYASLDTPNNYGNPRNSDVELFQPYRTGY